MTTLANPMNSGVANSSIISVPCMVNSSLYTWSETMVLFGSNSWSRMMIAMTPAIRKKPNEVIRYMYPMTLWSVDESQPASTPPLRSVRCRGMIGVPVTGECCSVALTWPLSTSAVESAGHCDLVPQTAVEVEVVAAGLAGGGVGDVGVQRVPVVGGLLGSAGADDRAEPARDAGTGGRLSGQRRPVLRADTSAGRAGRGIGGEPVQSQALEVGQ